MGYSYTTTPSGDLTLVRENTLAQGIRKDDGSYLKNVVWSNVNLYSQAYYGTVASSHFVSSWGSNFYTYSGKYLYGEVSGANKYITTSGLNYYGETSSLAY